MFHCLLDLAAHDTPCCDLPGCLHLCAGGAGSIIIGLATQQLLTNAIMGLSLVRANCGSHPRRTAASAACCFPACGLANLS